MFIGREAEKMSFLFDTTKWGGGLERQLCVTSNRRMGCVLQKRKLICLLSAEIPRNILGECKFKKLPFRYSDYLDTKAKLTSLKENAKFHYVLFSESGFDEKIVNEARNGILSLYGLKEIVNYK